MTVPLTRKLRGFMQQHAPLMISCTELEGFIDDYLDGTLPRRQRLVFQIHLFFCRECRDYLDSYRRAIALGKGAFQQKDTPIPEELVQAILAARGRAED